MVNYLEKCTFWTFLEHVINHEGLYSNRFIHFTLHCMLTLLCRYIIWNYFRFYCFLHFVFKNSIIYQFMSLGMSLVFLSSLFVDSVDHTWGKFHFGPASCPIWPGYDGKAWWRPHNDRCLRALLIFHVQTRPKPELMQGLSEAFEVRKKTSAALQCSTINISCGVCLQSASLRGSLVTRTRKFLPEMPLLWFCCLTRKGCARLLDEPGLFLGSSYENLFLLFRFLVVFITPKEISWGMVARQLLSSTLNLKYSFPVKDFRV